MRNTIRVTHGVTVSPHGERGIQGRLPTIDLSGFGKIDSTELESSIQAET